MSWTCSTKVAIDVISGTRGASAETPNNLGQKQAKQPLRWLLTSFLPSVVFRLGNTFCVFGLAIIFIFALLH